MSTLLLDHIDKYYGKTKAVDHLYLDVKEGELVTLLGPSGCGKTTTLRCVSGFLRPDKGDIYIGKRKVTDIPPEKRGIGLVFQNYALWPHMTVFQNLAFGLQLKKFQKKDIEQKVGEALATVKLEGMEERYPRQLSGGQQQRVALARALVLEPDILLLDEPLSNLDALLREQMRFEIAELQKRYGITTIYVTHDQTEAMVISDRIVVLNNGKIMQEGSPVDIYSKPANKFVAGFMGTTSFIEGSVQGNLGKYVQLQTNDGLFIYGIGEGFKEGDRASVVVRPENIGIIEKSSVSHEEDAKNIFKVSVLRASYVGEVIDYKFKVKNTILRAKGDAKRPLRSGDTVTVYLNPDELPIIRSD
ncbi:MAG: polyamine ABC transporter ATP-binding protein [Spirochaetes bacterium]|nr:MAG: polyamine ABC transporter ATP-binding protein [Spirochaetota bacterium]